MLLTMLTNNHGLAAAIARESGLSRPYVWQCAAGRRRWPLTALPAIERATEGRVTVEQLRPDVRWHRVPDPAWPHPQGRPCIDVAAPAEVRDAA
jgi:DNA-binding transcriptional regulator YdaS (Cro superfamily)